MKNSFYFLVLICAFPAMSFDEIERKVDCSYRIEGLDGNYQNTYEDDEHARCAKAWYEQHNVNFFLDSNNVLKAMEKKGYRYANSSEQILEIHSYRTDTGKYSYSFLGRYSYEPQYLAAVLYNNQKNMISSGESTFRIKMDSWTCAGCGPVQVLKWKTKDRKKAVLEAISKMKNCSDL